MIVNMFIESQSTVGTREAGLGTEAGYQWVTTELEAGTLMSVLIAKC